MHKLKAQSQTVSHSVTLCVPLQVPGSDPPHFKMHLKPGTPDKPGNHDTQTISRAGEGPGLQVAPGSVSEVRAGHCSSLSEVESMHACGCMGAHVLT
jgi:hypothetical protein